MTTPSRQTLETRLNDFDESTRRDALAALEHLAPPPDAHVTQNFNMHAHSFFSYNAHGWSPSRIAWEGKKLRLYAMALCDFDLLDGLEEFLAAGRLLALRTACHLETRAYAPKFAAQDINSPGEPGVTYIMASAFPAVPDPGTPAHDFLKHMRESAAGRNAERVRLVNAALPSIAIDIQRDLLPLTPSRCPTERHIVQAYVTAAETAYPDPAARADFWAAATRKSPAQITQLEKNDRPAFDELVRAALLKRGAPGYTAPTPSTFPDAGEFCAFAVAANAIPTATWLDGTLPGEALPSLLLDHFAGLGCAALNIIPDRNWNLSDATEKAVKVANLGAIVREAVKRDLPINIGTELNKVTNPFADQLLKADLNPFAPVFTAGAQIMVGHTLLARYADAPLLGGRAKAEFKTARERNAFYAKIGALPPLDESLAEYLRDLGPEKAYGALVDEMKKQA
ncbi:MAG: hypothetical protein FWF96_01905 [Kiritimatiellaeota bacterium]|nr:hypothetical protein [Kiritimatiellota bacterium]